MQVKEEFGSFSNYCWRFVNHKPIVNGFRYARNVPVKTPKAEVISKDMMKRGFRCVGPTIVYSFMQAAGIVNDHVSSCFRYKECHPNIKKDCAAEVEEMDKLVKSAEQACLLQAWLMGCHFPYKLSSCERCTSKCMQCESHWCWVSVLMSSRLVLSLFLCLLRIR